MTKFRKNLTLLYWTNGVKSTPRCKLLNRWPRKPWEGLCYFKWADKQREKWQNSLRTKKDIFYWIRLSSDMKNSADLGGFYLHRTSASVDNTLYDLQNSSYHTQPHSIIAKSLKNLLLPVFSKLHPKSFDYLYCSTEWLPFMLMA